MVTLIIDKDWTPPNTNNLPLIVGNTYSFAGGNDGGRIEFNGKKFTDIMPPTVYEGGMVIIRSTFVAFSSFTIFQTTPATGPYINCSETNFQVGHHVFIINPRLQAAPPTYLEELHKLDRTSSSHYIPR